MSTGPPSGCGVLIGGSQVRAVISRATVYAPVRLPFRQPDLYVSDRCPISAPDNCRHVYSHTRNVYPMSGDTLKSIDRETYAEGARMLAGLKSRKQHDAYLAQVEARLAAIGASWLDLLSLPRDEQRPGEDQRPMAVGED